MLNATPPVSASDLFAAANGAKNGGNDRCHWCASPCQKLLIHDDDPPIPFVRGSQYRKFAKCPGNGYICLGCWLFRRKRTTVQFLSGRLLDGKCPMDHCWWVTEQGAWGIDAANDGKYLYPLLFKPPLMFSLSFADGVQNHLQLQNVCQPKGEIDGLTELTFTVNGAPLTYSIYELEECLKGHSQGVSPGTRELVKILGPFKLPDDPKRERGRPPEAEKPANVQRRKVVAASGAAA